ncbi:MAG: protein TolQ [Proteobacteria bacterium]|nr:protein TolQ [Pseudomonadota bacterium]MBU1686451.1 protein TolQ [Pseudomonadota bacterium]
MFYHAGIMVKFVMLLLLFFSFGSWYIIFNKFMLYRKVRLDSGKFLKTFWGSKNLAEVNQATSNDFICPEATIFRLGYLELQKITKSKPTGTDGDSLEMRFAGIENIKRSIDKAEAMETARLGKLLPFLATTGSATPFIGLFGTVWGIMTSFQEIGKMGSASLAVVAPGISEALVATAAGLAVAIPAVVFYNFYANQLTALEERMQSFSSDLLNLIERDCISKK